MSSLPERKDYIWIIRIWVLYALLKDERSPFTPPYSPPRKPSKQRARFVWLTATFNHLFREMQLNIFTLGHLFIPKKPKWCSIPYKMTKHKA